MKTLFEEYSATVLMLLSSLIILSIFLNVFFNNIDKDNLRHQELIYEIDG